MFEVKASKGGKRQEIEEMTKILKNNSEIPVIIENLQKFKPDNVILLEAHRILEINGFLNSIENILGEMEIFLKGKPKVLTFFDLVEEDQLNILRVKVWSQFNRFRMHLLRQNADGLNLDVFLKNGYETHGNINIS